MKKGFTLLEIVIVVTLIGLVLAFMSIKFYSVSNKLKLQAASKMIVSDLRLAEQKAAAQKEMVSIVFDFDSYGVQSVKKDLPSPIRVVNPQTVAFSSSGQPIPGFFGTIVLTDGKTAVKIIISPAGRIRTE